MNNSLMCNDLPSVSNTLQHTNESLMRVLIVIFPNQILFQDLV